MGQSDHQPTADLEKHQSSGHSTNTTLMMHLLIISVEIRSIFLPSHILLKASQHQMNEWGSVGGGCPFWRRLHVRYLCRKMLMWEGRD